jgi:tetratricopeptide (TPR) repeat protein
MRTPRDEEAIAACSRLVDLAPDNVRFYTDRGNAYLAKADDDRAIADLDQAIKLDPKFALPYYARGSAYLSKGDYDCAIADFIQPNGRRVAVS